MAVVTFTTDWGAPDYFAGALKGAILKQVPGTSFVDISHQISKFDQVQGSYILKNAWSHFPDGSLHIAGVSGSDGSVPKLLAIKFRNHFFLGPDDGIFSLIFEEQPGDVYYVQNSRGEKVELNSEVMVASAVYLLKGGMIADMGDKVKEYKRKSILQPTIEENTIKGSVLFIDSYGNLVSNITRDLFDRIGRERKFEISLKRNDYTIERISSGYHDEQPGAMVAIYNDAGYLEIAIRNGKAATLLGMKYGEIIRIDFR